MEGQFSPTGPTGTPPSIPESLPAAILDSSPAIIFAKDPAGRYLMVNRQWESVLHIPRTQVIGKTDFDFFPPPIAETFVRHDQLAAGSGPTEVEETAPLEDGMHVYLTQKFPVRSEAGAFIAICGIATDITARKRAERELEVVADRFQLLVNTVEDYAIILTDPDGRILSWNRGAERIAGYSAGEATGRNISILYPPDDVAAGRPAEVMRRAAAEGRVQEEGWRVRKDASTLWASTLVTALRADDGSLTGFAQITRDMTEYRSTQEALRSARDALEAAVQDRTRELAAEVAGRERAEQKAREGQALLERVAEAVPHSVYVYDLREGRIVYVNRYALEFLPPAAEERSAGELEMLVHPEDRDRVSESLAALKQSGGGELIDAEYRLRNREGEWRWIYSRNSVFRRAADGSAEQIVGTAQDVTIRKQAEQRLRDSEAALHESTNRLRALAQRLLVADEEERRALSRELHDDLNQRLAVIAMDLHSISQYLPESGEVIRAELESVEGRVAELSEDLRRMAYQLRPSILDDLGLPAALRSYCADFSRREGIEVRVAARGIPPDVPGDVALSLYRVTQEALRNVAKHSSARRAVIRLGARGGNIWLFIRDFGSGFEPPLRAGRGLGIISMQERVLLARGTFRVRSRRGHGTCVTARIPIGSGL